MKYTYSDDDEDIYSDATTSRRSTRHTGTHTPAEGLSGPTVTLSGRQVKSRQGGAYGESMLSGTHTPAIAAGGFDGTSEEPENEESAGGRPRRAAATNHGLNGWGSKGGRHIEGYNDVDEMTSEDEDDASEQDYGDDEEEDVPLESDVDDPDELTDDDDEIDEAEKQSLIIKLPVKTPTPERKTAVKLRLTPVGDFEAGQYKQETPDLAPNRTSPTPIDKENINIQRLSPTVTPGPFAPLQSEAATKPINIPPRSPSIPAPASPMSPSLAFRGSPEKPQAFPASINVGYGGS
jgi:hypothetical protein